MQGVGLRIDRKLFNQDIAQVKADFNKLVEELNKQGNINIKLNIDKVNNDFKEVNDNIKNINNNVNILTKTLSQTQFNKVFDEGTKQGKVFTEQLKLAEKQVAELRNQGKNAIVQKFEVIQEGGNKTTLYSAQETWIKNQVSGLKEVNNLYRQIGTVTIGGQNYDVATKDLASFTAQVKIAEKEYLNLKYVLDTDTKEYKLGSLTGSDKSELNVLKEAETALKNQYNIRKELITAEGTYQSKLQRDLILQEQIYNSLYNQLDKVSRQSLNKQEVGLSNNYENTALKQEQNDILKSEQSLLQTKQEIYKENIKNLEVVERYESELKNLSTLLSTSKMPIENTNFKDLVSRYNELNDIIKTINTNETILNADEKKEIDSKISDIKRLNKEYENLYNKQKYLENLGKEVNFSSDINVKSPQKDIEGLVKEIGGVNAEIKKVDIQPYEKYGEEVRKVTYRVKEGEDQWHLYQLAITQAGKSGETSVRQLDMGTKDVITRQVGLFGRLKHALESVLSFSLVSGGYFLLINELKKSIQYVIEMDTALTDLNKVVDMSKSQMNEMKQSALELGKQLGQSSVDIMKGFAEFGRVTKNLNEIKELTRTAIMASNVTDLSVADASKSLSTAMISMNIPFKDSIKILDSWNEIQNNFKTSATDMADSIGVVGSVARQTSTDINTLNGYTTALVSSQGIQGSEAGTAIKAFISRIYRLGSDGANDAGKSELALKKIGVTIRNSQGDFRAFSDILNDVKSKWDTLSKSEQLFIAQQIGSTHHFSKFIGLMDNFDIATSATEKSINSQNSALIENEKYLNSVQGQWKLFKTNMEGVYAQLMQSEGLKNIISVINSVITGVGNIIGYIGLLKTALIGLNVYIKAFKKDGRIFDMSFDFKTNSFDIGGKLKDVIEKFKNFKEEWKKLNTQYKTDGGNMLVNPSLLDKVKNGFQALTGATMKQVMANLALKAVSGLLNIAIGGVIGVIETFAFGKIYDWITSIINKAQEAKEKADELYKSAQQNIQTYQGNITQIQSMSSEYETLSNKTQLTKEETERYIEIKKTLGSMFPEIVKGINSETGELDLQTKSTKELIEALKEKIRIENLKVVNETGNEKYKEYIDNTTKAKNKLGEINAEIQSNSQKMNEYKTRLLSSGASETQMSKALEPFITKNKQLIEQTEIAKQSLQDEIDMFKPIVKAMFDADLAKKDLTEGQKNFISEFTNNIDFTKVNGGFNGVYNIVRKITSAMNEGKDTGINKVVNDIIKLQDLLSNGKINNQNYLKNLNLDLANLGRLLGITDISVLKNLIDLLTKPQSSNSSITQATEDIATLQKNIQTSMDKAIEFRSMMKNVSENGITSDIADKVIGNPENYKHSAELIQAITTGNKNKVIQILKQEYFDANKEYQSNNTKYQKALNDSLESDEKYFAEKKKLLKGKNGDLIKVFTDAVGINVNDLDSKYKTDLNNFKSYIDAKVGMLKDLQELMNISNNKDVFGKYITVDKKTGKAIVNQSQINSEHKLTSPSYALAPNTQQIVTNSAKEIANKYNQISSKLVKGLDQYYKPPKAKATKSILPTDNSTKTGSTKNTSPSATTTQNLETFNRYEKINDKLANDNKLIKDTEAKLENATEQQKISLLQQENKQLATKKQHIIDLQKMQRSEESALKKALGSYINKDGSINYSLYNAGVTSAKKSKSTADDSAMATVKARIDRYKTLKTEINSTLDDNGEVVKKVNKNLEDIGTAIVEKSKTFPQRYKDFIDKAKDDIDSLADTDTVGKNKIFNNLLNYYNNYISSLEKTNTQLLAQSKKVTGKAKDIILAEIEENKKAIAEGNKGLNSTAKDQFDNYVAQQKKSLGITQNEKDLDKAQYDYDMATTDEARNSAIEKKNTLLQQQKKLYDDLKVAVEYFADNNKDDKTGILKSFMPDFNTENDKNIQDTNKNIADNSKSQFEAFSTQLEDKLKVYDDASDDIQDQIDLLDETDYNSKTNLTNQLIKNEQDRQIALQGTIKNLKDKLTEVENDKTLGKNSDRWKEINELIEKYIDSLNDLEKSEKNLLKTTKEIKESQISVVNEVQDKVKEMLKKQVDDYKKTEDENYEAFEKDINRRLELLDKVNEAEDYNKSIKDQSKTITDLEADISTWSQDDSYEAKEKVKELTEQLNKEKEALTKLQNDHERELLKKSLQQQLEDEKEATDKRKELIEENYSDEKVAVMAKQALMTGYFTDINGRVVSLTDAMTTYISNTVDALGVYGDKIKSEFIDKLNQALTIVKQMPSALNGITTGNTTSGNFSYADGHNYHTGNTSIGTTTTGNTNTTSTTTTPTSNVDTQSYITMIKDYISKLQILNDPTSRKNFDDETLDEFKTVINGYQTQLSTLLKISPTDVTLEKLNQILANLISGKGLTLTNSNNNVMAYDDGSKDTNITTLGSFYNIKDILGNSRIQDIASYVKDKVFNNFDILKFSSNIMTPKISTPALATNTTANSVTLKCDNMINVEHMDKDVDPKGLVKEVSKEIVNNLRKTGKIL